MPAWKRSSDSDIASRNAASPPVLGWSANVSWRSAASARTSMTGAVAGWEPGSSPNFWRMLRNLVRKSPQNSQSSVTIDNLIILAGLALTPKSVSGKLPLVQFNEVCHENQHHTKYGSGPLPRVASRLSADWIGLGWTNQPAVSHNAPAARNPCYARFEGGATLHKGD